MHVFFANCEIEQNFAAILNIISIFVRSKRNIKAWMKQKPLLKP